MDILFKLKSMTTGIGIYQHGKLDMPAPAFGYALEDQARALIVASLAGDGKLKDVYLGFILRAIRKDGLLYHFYFENGSAGFFKNSETGIIENTEEAFAITLWSLQAYSKNERPDENIEVIISNLKKEACKWNSPRAIATALLGLAQSTEENRLENVFKEKLLGFLSDSASGDWIWFEECLTYANAIMPWALWENYLKKKCPESFKAALKTTDFLIGSCQENKIPGPIGNKGWYCMDGRKAMYDQQPVDAAYMVCCLEKAYEATGKKQYLEWAGKWYGWFFGNNINHISMIDSNMGCYDGLTREGVNLNQGAESNICFVMAYFAARRMGITT
jgi:hypothetical protein